MRHPSIAKFDLARQWLHANEDLELLECDIDWPQMRCPTLLAPVQSYLPSIPSSRVDARIIHTHLDSRAGERNRETCWQLIKAGEYPIDDYQVCRKSHLNLESVNW